MDQKIVEKILESLEEGYDRIAKPKFSETRKHLWRELEFIQDYVKIGDRVLDFGCGNGRLANFLKGKYGNYVGLDVSGELVQLAQENNQLDFNASFQRIDRSGRIPFADKFFNTVFSIAVFHHLPGGKLRLQIARELFRVTAPGGVCVVTAWNLWQKKYRKFVWNNIWETICLRSLIDLGDAYIPFRVNDENVDPFLRYHHAFTTWGLKRLMKKAGFEVEWCKIVSGRNIVCVARRVE